MQLSMRRRMEKVHATSTKMNMEQLRQALDEASNRAGEQERSLPTSCLCPQSLATLDGERTRQPPIPSAVM